MSDAKYENRQNFEMGHWPELRHAGNDMLKSIVLGRELPGEPKQMVFAVASLAIGCVNRQSHGACHLHKIRMPDEKVQAFWSFEASDLISDAERAALSLALAAGTAPNASGSGHFV